VAATVAAAQMPACPPSPRYDTPGHPWSHGDDSGPHPLCEPAQTGRSVTPDDLGQLGHDQNALRGVSLVVPERPEDAPCTAWSHA